MWGSEGGNYEENILWNVIACSSKGLQRFGGTSSRPKIKRSQKLSDLEDEGDMSFREVGISLNDVALQPRTLHSSGNNTSAGYCLHVYIYILSFGNCSNWISLFILDYKDFLTNTSFCFGQVVKVKRYSYLCNRLWRPIGLWEVDTPAISGQSARRWRWGSQLHAPAAI
jgi:hypothetical protein